MSETEADSSEMWRLIGAALLLAIVCAAVALMALRADAQPPAGQPHAATTAPATAPPAPADSIPDDPTIAPDPRQKADNNVSFPVDI